MRACHVRVVVSLVCLLLVPKTDAQRETPPLSAEEVALDLSSSDQDEVLRGLEAAAALGNEEAALLVSERVREGLPGPLLTAATESLAMLPGSEATEVLALLSRHRRVALRVEAVVGLSLRTGAAAEAALVRALSDPDPRVRDAAASGLGQMGGSQASEALTRALRRGVDAASALGSALASAAVPELGALAQEVPFERIAPAIDLALSRSDVLDKHKIVLIERLSRDQVRGARDYLMSVRERLSVGLSPKVAAALVRAAAEVGR